jgi:hypothetical protein
MEGAVSDGKCHACDKSYDLTVLDSCPYCDTPNPTFEEADWAPKKQRSTAMVVVLSMLVGGALMWWFVSTSQNSDADLPPRHAKAIAEFNRLNGTTHDSKSLKGVNVESIELGNRIVSTIQARISQVNTPPESCEDLTVFICAAHEAVYKSRKLAWDYEGCLAKLSRLMKKHAGEKAWSNQACRKLFAVSLKGVDRLMEHSQNFIGVGELAKKSNVNNLQESGNLAVAALLSQATIGILSRAGISVVYGNPAAGSGGSTQARKAVKPQRARGACGRLIARCRKVLKRASKLERKVARKGMMNVGAEILTKYQIENQRLNLCYQFLGTADNMRWHLGKNNQYSKEMCRTGLRMGKNFGR